MTRLILYIIYKDMKHRIYIHNIENLQKGDYFSTFQEIYQVENIEVAWVHYAPTHKRLFHILAYRVRDIIQKPFFLLLMLVNMTIL